MSTFSRRLAVAFVGLGALALGLGSHLAAQQDVPFNGTTPRAPQGLKIPPLPDAPVRFETGEGQTIKVSVYARGFNNPWSMVWVADVHHYLSAGSFFIPDQMTVDCKLNGSFVDVTLCPFSARHCDLGPRLQYMGRVAGPYNARQTEFAADNGAVAGPAASIGNDGGGFFHNGFPGRVGH